MSHRPDFLNGRGIGWACPLASAVRQRRVYSPAGRPGKRAAQWAFASRIGHALGRPAPSKPGTPFGSAAPHAFGGGKISASDHGAFVKYGSSAGHASPAGCTHTCTFDSPETPTWA